MLSATDVRELERLATEIESSKPRAAQAIRKAIAPTASQTADEYASVGEASRILRVSDQTIRNWVDSGWLQGIRRGPLRRRFVLRSSLEAVQRFDSVQLQPKTAMTEDDAARVAQEHRRERARS
ncbi:MAG: helix-turn-helix domain-containing protein [Candidatus Limnocylindria bacterium]